MTRSRAAGFTLVEILVSIVIISTIMLFAMGNFLTSLARSRDGERKSDLGQVARAVELYYNDHGEYPVSNVAGEIVGCGGNPCAWGEEFADANGTMYMVSLPVDPRPGLSEYFYDSDGTFFQVYTRLERTDDPEVPKLSGNPANYGVDCGNLECNFGLSSPNITVESGRVIAED